MEKEIVYTALENLPFKDRFKPGWEENGPLDGVLKLTINGKEQIFLIEVKNEIRTHHIVQLEQYRKEWNNFMLLAYRLFPNIKEQLRQKGIPYLEANGNLFLDKEETFLFIDTQKALEPEKNRGNRAFTKTGLKVLFYLLQRKEAINFTHRELAEKANVALGNIPQVIEGLKETAYLISLDNKNYIWENRRSLLDRWIYEYGSILRPKLIKERYTINSDWRQLKLDSDKTVWGGEAAADLLTNHLRPEKFQLYSVETRIDLIKKYRLKPDPMGEVQVLEMFWKAEQLLTAPPLLVYADLILEGGKRNKETADKIFHDYIEPNL
ncbi:type IV toxin-antitoxin system AbiEi family antitoxin [Desertivirga brevis]|uniref:type IV toxin-antitoxin system AbiEi family antitoxin n=1 Tax=Desertivirga brevis TaxID=2810310 RepID=UPI001A959602|nr:type IV toxin-antitoxin system AbiEi family antitoxin [Pedobacter sp. SYSU D00873]